MYKRYTFIPLNNVKGKKMGTITKILMIIFLLNFFLTDFNLYDGSLVSKILATIVILCFIIESILTKKSIK